MNYDVIIVGGGPAGLTSAIYTSRAMQKTLVIEERAVGGQMVLTTEVENYPGFPDGIMGAELGSLMEKQARRFGAEIRYGSFKGIDTEKKVLKTSEEEISFKALILALGAEPAKLGLPKEEELTGRGISYCATCDGAFFREQKVAVIGGGNTALEEALFLTNFASKVYLIHRRDSFRGEKYLQEKVKKNPKIETVLSTIPKEIIGENDVNGLRVFGLKDNREYVLDVTGVFIFVGYKPKTEIIKGVVELNEQGYIKADRYLRTSVPFIFACGDCIDKPYKQIASAVGDGCVAGMSAVSYIEYECL
ncbi:MAG: thioredoxin-disulfide reductase [Proteobacteria bacterium]|nr:thioredoxin-disulfide reductase [Pseudomonadota bacterium]